MGPVVSEEKSFEIVDRWTKDGQTTEAAYTISSPEAFGSGELKAGHNFLFKKTNTVQLDDRSLH